ncbi:hypothetical protein ASF10_07190 [Flavobacterium sp. Leaf82]|uniref:hypothetical protein n=1 Tax=Flavobacterium sp. Leaf82 TaxID=1736238 RepID=UPI0006F83947|nr:hypothetical protein [Flavobacterium sp. Leaf82]KQO24949.1 hypothetical protein ASF10_07190 [Flavobacterium sp. Leaf82]
MKNTILSLFLFLIFICCSKQNKNESLNDQIKNTKNNLDKKNNEIAIKYSTPIKGYNVSAKWLIRGKIESKFSKNFKGPAILTFENIKTKEIFWVIHPEFTIDIDKENLKHIIVVDDEFVKNESFTQVCKYVKPKFEKVGTSKEEEGFGYVYIPFFFQDVDFDDVDELILTYATTYEKGGSINKIFKKGADKNLEFSEMTNEPFTNFSGFYYGNPNADAYNYTTIDYKNKTISHHESSGDGGSREIIYEFKKTNNNPNYILFGKIDKNNFENSEIQKRTVFKYNDYGEIVSVDKIKQPTANARL